MIALLPSCERALTSAPFDKSSRTMSSNVAEHIKLYQPQQASEMARKGSQATTYAMALLSSAVEQ
jgi:hypothetical protein